MGNYGQECWQLIVCERERNRETDKTEEPLVGMATTKVLIIFLLEGRNPLFKGIETPVSCGPVNPPPTPVLLLCSFLSVVHGSM